jgi:hypothetical protein
VKKIYSDQFDSFDNYWAEGGQAAWVADNRLYHKADPHIPVDGAVGDEGGVSTIWCRTPFPADVEIRVKACVVSSQFGANNINLFLSYTPRAGETLWDTRDQRADGDYAHYHDLEGYIYTFIRDWKYTGGIEGEDLPARYRMRRCPGFNLLTEKREGLCEQEKVYDLKIRKQGGQLSFIVDGQLMLEAIDPTPLGGGYFGFRTFRTELWWSDLEVWAI